MPINDHALVFVHVGGMLPTHTLCALKQARLFNSCDIFLVANSESILGEPELESLDITTVPCEELKPSPVHVAFNKHSPLDRTERNGFWHVTSERFFYLEAFARTLPGQAIFHIENDVMLYRSLRELRSVLKREKVQVAGTLDNDIRCVPGFTYFDSAECLGALTQFFLDVVQFNSLPELNDMILFAAYWRNATDRPFTPLPVVPSHYPYALTSRAGHEARDPKTYSNLFAQFESIFDAAAIGQFLGGVDPRNAGNVGTVGFVNESAVYNPSHFEFKWELDGEKRWRPYALLQGHSTAINNLHIHSKNLRAFRSDQAGIPGP